jgi:hypothetical protein
MVFPHALRRSRQRPALPHPQRGCAGQHDEPQGWSAFGESNGPQAVADKIPQTTAWAFERKGGGRGFGFTGGHFHHNWGNDNQRKLVLNAILWTAKAEVPVEGVPSKVSPEELEANQDPKPGSKPNPKTKEQASTNHGDCKQCAFSAAGF